MNNEASWKMVVKTFIFEGLGKTLPHTHQSDPGDKPLNKQRHYPISQAVQKWIDSEIERMLKLGVIEESELSWNSPIVLVKNQTEKADYVSIWVHSTK